MQNLFIANRFKNYNAGSQTDESLYIVLSKNQITDFEDIVFRGEIIIE